MSPALLIIDLQNGVCKSLFNSNNLINCVNNRISFYRNKNYPIIFIQHEGSTLKRGSTDRKFVSLLDYRANDIVIKKTHPNSFYKTNLRETLTNLGIDRLEICGAQTEYCVDATIKVAHSLGYQLVMKHGASSTRNNSYMTAQDTINFYENIWSSDYLTFI
ncbi:cysteine hydrolase family protein [Limosilactobacillus agrestimuris]|uniref:cysteine hydrolase family protein n=1 Tax=Limosilactobacillus agrestimuris TaxID=2941331 RepID=UPI00203C3182|nr:cysteine hydrolase family protein [Limosilactobacillus agrestimuris]